MKSLEGIRYHSLVLLKSLLSQSYSGTFYPKELQEVNLNEDRVYRLLGYVTEGSPWEAGELWGCARFTMGCLREEPKTGEGKEQIRWERNKCGEIQQKGDKRSWKYVNRLLVSTFVSKCSQGQGSIPGGNGFSVLKDVDSQAVQITC